MKQKRRVLKKGKFVITRKGSFVKKLADNLLKELKPLSKKIQIAGSIRREKVNPVDIDIVLIPKDKKKIKEFLKRKGNFIQGGEKKVTFRIKGVKVELYYTIPEEWGATLLAYSNKFGSSIGLRVIAKLKGLKLNQHGLFDKKGKSIAGKTEEEIYKTLGRKWKLPKDR